MSYIYPTAAKNKIMEVTHIIYIYIICIYICQDGGDVGFVDLLSFHSLCLHLRSHLIKWEVLQNTSS